MARPRLWTECRRAALIMDSEGGFAPLPNLSPQTVCAGEAGARSGTPIAHRRSRGAGACYSDGLLIVAAETLVPGCLYLDVQHLLQHVFAQRAGGRQIADNAAIRDQG